MGRLETALRNRISHVVQIDAAQGVIKMAAERLTFPIMNATQRIRRDQFGCRCVFSANHRNPGVAGFDQNPPQSFQIGGTGEQLDVETTVQIPDTGVGPSRKILEKIPRPQLPLQPLLDDVGTATG